MKAFLFVLTIFLPAALLAQNDDSLQIYLGERFELLKALSFHSEWEPFLTSGEMTIDERKDQRRVLIFDDYLRKLDADRFVTRHAKTKKDMEVLSRMCKGPYLAAMEDVPICYTTKVSYWVYDNYLLKDSQNRIFMFNQNKMQKVSGTVLRAWIKAICLNKTAEGELYEAMTYYEFDIKNRKYRQLHRSEFDRKGNGINDYSNERSEWLFIVPDTILENIIDQLTILKPQ